MKHLLSFSIITLLILIGSSACKPTESNYRSAYLAAKEMQLTGDSLTDVQLLNQQRPRPVVFGSDTLPMRTEYIGYTKDGGADSDKTVVKRYCVVVGKFKQVFNARSMRQRLMQSGYHRALVLHNQLKDYYVIANTTADPHIARLMLDSVLADPGLTLKPPYPYILRPGHLAR